MITVRLKGGLGNQMFQFAFASILAMKISKPLYLDLQFFKPGIESRNVTPRNFELSIFKNNYNIATHNQINKFYQLSKLNKLKRKLNLNYPKRMNELSFEYERDNFKVKPPVYVNGYFQSYKYYKGHEAFVKSLFKFPMYELDKSKYVLYSKMKSLDSVSVHIRRGDYVANQEVQRHHGNCSMNYYRKAIELMKSKMVDPEFFFFSDDINWVKKNFEHFNVPKHFVSKSNVDTIWMDMYLMSTCAHNIIANSSYSWWGAWLNSNPKKIVVAPLKWFSDDKKNSFISDLIPPTWITI